MKRTFFFIMFFLVCSCAVVFAQNNTTTQEEMIPQDVMTFFFESHGVQLSNTSLELHQIDMYQVFYSFVNNQSEPMSLYYTIECVSDNCPINGQLFFEYITQEEVPAERKKISGIVVVANNSKVGKFAYNFSIYNNQTNQLLFVDTIDVTVFTLNFWTEFWYQLQSLFFFWK